MLRQKLPQWMVVAILLAVCWAGAEQLTDWRRVIGPPELDLPRDHGAHPEYRTEWWYVTGLVTDDQGRRYGFQITFFRQGLDPTEPAPGSSKLRARQVMAAHLAVADIKERKFYHAERLRRVAGGLAGASEGDLDLWLDDWRMRRATDDAFTANAHDPAQAIGLALEMRPQRGLVRHGDGGYSRKGSEPGNASVYLSLTRLRVTGELEVGARSMAVEGEAWFDHEWGSSQLDTDTVGWDWFSLRLDDGNDLMVYLLRRADGSAGPFSSGTLVRPDGETVVLSGEGIEIEPRGWWESQKTNVRYPIDWKLRVPVEGIDLDLRSLMPNCELDGSATTGVVYWEGPIEATGSHSGEGYLEMTGYAGSMSGVF